MYGSFKLSGNWDSKLGLCVRRLLVSWQNTIREGYLLTICGKKTHLPYAWASMNVVCFAIQTQTKIAQGRDYLFHISISGTTGLEKYPHFGQWPLQMVIKGLWQSRGVPLQAWKEFWESYNCEIGGKVYWRNNSMAGKLENSRKMIAL